MSRRLSISRGFTLVELLVVLGIIALLISIMMPALKQAKQVSMMIQCMSNCRTMAQAAMMHAADHKGYFPIAGLEWDLSGGVCNPRGLDDPGKKKYSYYLDGGIYRPMPVTAALGQYMGLRVPTDSRQSLQNFISSEAYARKFQCPAQDVVPLGKTQQGADGWVAPLERMSFVFNEALLGRRERSKPTQPTPEGSTSRVKNPSQLFLFGDGLPRGLNSGDWLTMPETGDNLWQWTLLDYWNTYQSNSKNFDTVRHQGRTNIVFWDGHAETVRMPKGLANVGLTKWSRTNK